MVKPNMETILKFSINIACELLIWIGVEKSRHGCDVEWGGASTVAWGRVGGTQIYL